MSLFAGIENAKTSERLPNIRPGLYTLQVQALKAFTSRAKGPMFVAEFSVLESSGPDANAPGSSASHIIKMSLDSALGNIQGLMAAVLNVPTEKVTESICDEAVSAKGSELVKGAKVRAEATVVKTKAGGDFTRVRYRPFEAPAQAPKAAAKK